MKNKIGLVLAYKGTNYGMLLQAYATQQVIEKYGFKTEILEHKKTIMDRIPKTILGTYNLINVIINFAKNRFFTKRNEFDELHQINSEERKRVADAFRTQYLHNEIVCEGLSNLTMHSKTFQAVLVGSDQLWLPEVAFNPFYTLRFAAPGVTRISYATSLGVTSYPKYCKKAAADYWTKIDFLSVREEKGKQLIQSICNVPVTTVCDPTYLLTKEEWLQRIPQNKVVQSAYVLCYFLGDDVVAKRRAAEYAKEHKLRTVSILSNESNADETQLFDEILHGKTPVEFINLIRNAECIFTDSFHGVAFSVINEKSFYVFYRVRAGEKQSRNSLIDNILNLWGLQERLISDPNVQEIPISAIDYEKVNEKKRTVRRDSLEFLKKALNVGETCNE